MDYWSAAPFTTSVRLHAGDRVTDFGLLEGDTSAWRTAVLEPVGPDAATGVEINTSGIYGTGSIQVLALDTFDGAGSETLFFQHGTAFELRLRFQINQPDLAGAAQVLVAFHRDGGLDVCRLITRELDFDAARARHGTIRLRIPALRLANGAYTLSVMIAREGYYDAPQAQYFALNPGVFACLSRALEINVFGGGPVVTGTVFMDEGEWTMEMDRVTAVGT
jgi:hypothetical protein